MVMMKPENITSFCDHQIRVRDSCRSLGERCCRVVKELRARFYILRRCVTMLLCSNELNEET
ncbi:hypothetical protein SADUNF_Sadunf06G0039600 [Salix dunnii]|uniref:Uncharacterized protein n=1 Tax=Salix dunnii TaxID=1413687 RepID=A0A835K781_9ROSI|nr:hypothetical protein SADUNF_Sadunf06G0039600 [Salix dunnii]